MAALRIVFMGTPELASRSLEALLAEPAFQVVAVVTQPDRPKGRDLQLQPSPVKELALRVHLPVLQPERARAENFLQHLRSFAPDLIVVAAFGQILPPTILELPRFGCVNVHTSLLPKYRGAAPIQWAILNGETETGVTIMKMDAGMDTGPIVTQEKIVIRAEDTSPTLHDRLAKVGAELLVKTIPDFAAGKILPRVQVTEEASYAPKIKKQDGQINWSKSAVSIWNQVRALIPWPGTYTHLHSQPEPALIKIWQAEVAQGAGEPGQVLQVDKSGILVGCGEAALRLLVLQREGGRRLNAQLFLAGYPIKVGDRLG
jgi:methionyl-tRNA formyltransferase